MIKNIKMQTEKQRIIEKLLLSVDTIARDEELSKLFLEESGLCTIEVLDNIANVIAIDPDILSNKLLRAIRLTAPICYIINGTIFLEAGTNSMRAVSNVDDYDTELVELQDMTEEMTTGNSPSIFVDNTNYFKLASMDQITQVKKFLIKL